MLLRTIYGKNQQVSTQVQRPFSRHMSMRDYSTWVIIFLYTATTICMFPWPFDSETGAGCMVNTLKLSFLFM